MPRILCQTAILHLRTSDLSKLDSHYFSQIKAFFFSLAVVRLHPQNIKVVLTYDFYFAVCYLICQMTCSLMNCIWCKWRWRKILILQNPYLSVLTLQSHLGHNKWFRQLTVTAQTQLVPCEACHRSLLEGSFLFFRMRNKWICSLRTVEVINWGRKCMV